MGVWRHVHCSGVLGPSIGNLSRETLRRGQRRRNDCCIELAAMVAVDLPVRTIGRTSQRANRCILLNRSQERQFLRRLRESNPVMAESDGEVFHANGAGKVLANSLRDFARVSGGPAMFPEE